MDYVTGAKLDQVLEKLDHLISLKELEISKKYPELKETKK